MQRPLCEQQQICLYYSKTPFFCIVRKAAASQTYPDRFQRRPHIISPAKTTLAAIPARVARSAPPIVYLVLFTPAAIKYTDTV